MQTPFWQGIRNFLDHFFKSRMAPEEVFVSFDHEGITVIWPDGEKPYARWLDIENIVIETTEDGPFYEDAWWCFSIANYSIRIPNSAQGLGDLISELIKRGADEKRIIEAMGCTSNRMFLIWEKDKNN